MGAAAEVTVSLEVPVTVPAVAPPAQVPRTDLAFTGLDGWLVAAALALVSVGNLLVRRATAILRKERA